MSTGGTETAVRMGELATSARPGDVLACIGIGSCIALVLVDPSRGVIGLAHVMIPEGDGQPPARYANTAVPELIARTVASGAGRAQLRAAIVGGASMFSFEGRAPEEQIGARNEFLVRAHLELARIPIIGAATGGSNGRTLRVTAGAPIAATIRTRATDAFPLTFVLDTTTTTAVPSLLTAGTRAQGPNQTYETASEVVN